MNKFPERLKELRVKNHIYQKDMAALLSMKSNAYQRYEYGDRSPNFDQLIFIADYFHVSVDYLLGCTDNPIRNL